MLFVRSWLLQNNTKGTAIRCEITEVYTYNLVVQLLTRILCRQFHTDIVARKAMHRLTTGGLLKKHLGFLSDITGIKIVNFTVGQTNKTFATKFLVLLANDIRYGQSRCTWSL